MPRIVMGNRDGAEALRQARAVLAELTDEWPDVPIVQRTIPGDDPGTLPTALLEERIGLAVGAVDRLPADLPDGVVLAAVARRQEARCALVSRNGRAFEDLEAGMRIATRAGRDEALVRALRPDLAIETLDATLDDALARLTREEVHALLLPAATLRVLDHGNRIDALLDPEVVPPAPGQGALAVLVREDDDQAAELAYTLHHRPSFDRVRAERAFAAALPDHPVGALATVSDDGDLELFGAVAAGGRILQARTSGDASEAASLGAELAQDVAAQLDALG